MICSCDGPPHQYDPSWCVSGPVPRPKNWPTAQGQGNVTVVINVNVNPS